MLFSHTTKLIIQGIANRLSRQQFIMFSAVLVGLTAGMAAVILKYFVHKIQAFLSLYTIFGWGYVIFPSVGILFTVYFIRTVLGGKLDKGMSSILFAIAKKSSFIHRSNMYAHIVTSAITVGFGGSAGLEGPIVATGAAIGSNYGKAHDLTYRERTLMLAAGAAAGVSAVFNAPIGGVMIAFEILLSETAISHFIPLMVASVSGVLCSRIILNENILFNFTLKQPFNPVNTPFYIILGVLCGFISLYYARIAHRIEAFFNDFPLLSYDRALFGGIILMILCLFFPPLFSEGYSSLKALTDGNPQEILQNTFFETSDHHQVWLLIFVALIVFFKPIATTTTLASGGNGGNFAPSIFVGGYLGFLFAAVCNIFLKNPLPITHFAVAGMAGVLSGVFYAPLSAIFLIAEVTGGYILLIPLMMVSSLSFFLVRQFEPYSMDTKRLALKGDIFTADKDHNILTLLKVSSLMDKDIPRISPNASLRRLVDLIKESKRNVFVVVNAEEELEGIILLDDVRNVIFDKELYDTIRVRQMMKRVPTLVDINEDMKSVMVKMEKTDSWYLPVVENGKYQGFLSKSDILGEYREAVAGQSDL